MNTPLPEPAVLNTHIPTGIKIYGYTEAQMHEYGAAEYKRAIEDAAQVCDGLQDVPATEARHCAQDIRLLGAAS